MKSTSTSLIAILGPTASGKTAYAIELAKRLNGAIISADSRQVYAGMNIGTAKPRDAWIPDQVGDDIVAHSPERPDSIDGVPHYLLNIATIDQTYTLSNWLDDARRVLEIILSNKQTPIIAGGTMLYIDALLDGYNLPTIEPNPEYRKRLEQQSPELLYEQLKKLDPAACAFIEPHNTRRIIRALEVMNATGEKFSDLRTSQAQYTSTRIGIFPEWEIMKTNIEKRSQDMLMQGLVQEARELRSNYPASPLLQTINYKQALELVDTTCTEQEALASMSQATLRYAHRQMSWWNRRNDIGWICV